MLKFSRHFTALFAFLLLLPALAQAQSTTVSGTVTDTPDNQTWNNGMLTATFVPNPQYPSLPSYSWTGGTLSNTVSANLSATGTYSVSLPSNSAITPINSQWSFKFCPAATANCYTLGNVTITGATQTVSATPPSIRISMANPPPSVTAYADGELTGVQIGSQYYNLTLASGRICTAVAGSSCTTWTASGSSGSAKNVIDGNDPKYGLFWDTVLLSDGVWTNGSPNVTSNQATFASADIGKTFKGTSGGTACGENQANNSVTTITGKILTITDAHHIVLDTNATATAATSACFAYGHLDDTGLTAMETAGKASLNCPIYKLPAGLGMMNSQHFNDKTAISATCQSIGSQVTSDSGAEVLGQGYGVTGIVLGPAFNPANCTGGVSSNSCMGGMNGGVYRDFFVHGICDARTGLSAGATSFFRLGYSDLIDHVNMRCYGQNDTGNFSSAIVDGTLGNSLSYVGVDGFGSRGFQINASPFYLHALSVGDLTSSGNGGAISVGGSGTIVFASDLSTFFGPNAANAYGILVNSGATLQVQNLVCIENLGTNVHIGFVNAGTANIVGGKCIVNGNTASTGIWNQTGGKLYAQNVVAQGGATGSDFFDDTTGTWVDQSGNVPNTGRIKLTATSNWSGIGALRGSCSGVATPSSTIGLYGLGQTTALTCTSTTVNLGQVAKQAGTAYGVIVSATAAGVNASSGVVTVLKNGVATTITCTIGTGTSCVDSAHTFTFVAGDVISVQFTTQAADTLAGVSATVVTM